MYFIDNCDWLSSGILLDVLPGVRKLMGDSIAKTLSLPIIYASTNDIPIPDYIKERTIHTLTIHSNRSLINGVVRKRPLIISGHGDQVNIIPIQLNNFLSNDSISSNRHGQSTFLNEFRGIQATLINMKKRMEEIHSNIRVDFQNGQMELQEKYERLDTSVKRIAIQPVMRRMESNDTVCAAKRTVNSKVIGTKAGTEIKGFPPIIVGQSIALVQI